MLIGTCSSMNDLFWQSLNTKATAQTNSFFFFFTIIFIDCFRGNICLLKRRQNRLKFKYKKRQQKADNSCEAALNSSEHVPWSVDPQAGPGIYDPWDTFGEPEAWNQAMESMK